MIAETAQVDVKPRVGALAWFALWLLVISVCINYADRGSLGIAATSLERELHLDPGQLGWLLSAFSITYAASLIISGKLVERFNVNWFYALAFLLWSGATGATSIARGFWSIMLLRLVLGVSESVAYPAYAKMIVTSFPEKLRGTSNGLIDAGSKLGPALGVYFGVKMLNAFTWRGMFALMGGASLLWLVPWTAIAGRLPSNTRRNGESVDTISLRQIASSRTLWGTALGLFGGNYAWFFLLNWLPYYFETERHYTKDKLAIMGSLPFLAIAASSTCFGLLADFLIHKGRDAGKVRQQFVCYGLAGCGILMFAAVWVTDVWQSNVLLVLAFITLGAWSSNHWAFSQFLSGKVAAGKWTGLQNAIGNLAGILGPAVSGYALKITHSFFSAFAIACLFLFGAVLSYWFIVGRPAQVFED